MIPKHLQEPLALRLVGAFSEEETTTVGDIVFRMAFAPEGHDSDYLLDLLGQPIDSIEHRAAVIILEVLT